MFRRNKKSSLWLEVAEHKVGLEFWLQAATDGLADPARKRIRAEIEGHYSEAVAAHMADGLAETEARTAAILELGDAGVAAKRFRKQHLTVRDAEKVEQAFRQAGNLRRLLYSYLCFLCASWLIPIFYRGWSDHRSFVIPLVVGFFAAVIAPTASFIMVQRKNKNMGCLLLTDSVASYVFPLSLIYYMFGFGSTFGLWFCVYSCTLLYDSPLRIWLKLRHVVNVWDEIPLRNK